MHAHEPGALPRRAFHERDVVVPVDQTLVHQHAEAAEPGGEARGRDAPDEPLVEITVTNQIPDRDEDELVPLREPHELAAVRHRSVRSEDLAQESRRLESREPHQIEGRFGVPGTLEHALVRGAERKDVSGARQILGLRPRVGERADGDRPVVRRGAGGRAAKEVHRDREGGRVPRGVHRGHEGKAQPFEPASRHGDADQAATFPRHEVDIVGRGFLRGHHEVPFVLAVLVVHDHHHPPGADRPETLVDARERSEGLHGRPRSAASPDGGASIPRATARRSR